MSRIPTLNSKDSTDLAEVATATRTALLGGGISPRVVSKAFDPKPPFCHDGDNLATASNQESESGSQNIGSLSHRAISETSSERLDGQMAESNASDLLTPDS
jgi:hypothetical protein